MAEGKHIKTWELWASSQNGLQVVQTDEAVHINLGFDNRSGWTREWMDTMGWLVSITPHGVVVNPNHAEVCRQLFEVIRIERTPIEGETEQNNGEKT